MILGRRDRKQTHEGPGEVVVMRHLRRSIFQNEIPARRVISRGLLTGRGPRSSDSGFSIVELIITLVLFGIVTTIAIPAFRGWSDNSNLKAAAREITSDCYQMRQRAMAENVRFRIAFNPDPTNTFTLQQETAPGSNAYNALLTKTLDEFPRITITGAVIGAGTTASFQPRGSSSAGTVSLANSRGSTATITLLMTGRVHVTYNIQ